MWALCSSEIKLDSVGWTTTDTRTGYRNLHLTTWSWDLLQRLMIPQVVKKFSLFYETRRFIIVFTRAHYWFLSWAIWIQSTSAHLISFRYLPILWWGVISLKFNPQDRRLPHFGCLRLLIRYIRNYPPTWRLQPEDVPVHGDNGPSSYDRIW